MSKRVQLNQKVTAWHDVSLAHAPEFGETKTWVVPGQHGIKKSMDGDDAIKVSFSFGHDRLLTPWLTLSSDVNVIRFQFTHAGGDLVDLHAQLVRDDAAREILARSWAQVSNQGPEEEGTDSSEADFLTLLYEWDEVSSEDPNAGLNGLFLSGFLFTLLSAAAVVVSLPMD